ncbi:unnamed protein product [Arctia plantaginis]|uniref:Uncharacterized protein n=1 Tax=Arctia plantaginis TaxID=874455 RepID=A0A8S0ZW30_ARCPL|nr:unnamed protein product [Arctia plantaginis]CAB3236163.1 unnamed protein product [Arctia plantaginis]
MGSAKYSAVVDNSIARCKIGRHYPSGMDARAAASRGGHQIACGGRPCRAYFVVSRAITCHNTSDVGERCVPCYIDVRSLTDTGLEHNITRLTSAPCAFRDQTK